MGRARRARKIAATAAYGGGGLAAASAALGAVGYAVIKGEALLARRIVGRPFDTSPDDDGTYGAGPGEPIEILVLGDSSAAGMGAHHPNETVGGIVASGVSALMGRRVHLTNCAVVGAESSDLERQLAQGLESVTPDVVVIMVGANDVTHRVDRATAVRHLEVTVRRIRALGSEVVVGTCPDLGTVRPIAPPLRQVARAWSRRLAAAQTIAVVEAGGRSVSVGSILGPEFDAAPAILFGPDKFHPSADGYRSLAAVLLPSTLAALGLAPSEEAHPEAWRGEVVLPVSRAAVEAARTPGTEVDGTEVGGAARGLRGRWVELRHRRRRPGSTIEQPAEAEHDAENGADAGAASADAAGTDGPA